MMKPSMDFPLGWQLVAAGSDQTGQSIWDCFFFAVVTMEKSISGLKLPQTKE